MLKQHGFLEKASWIAGIAGAVFAIFLENKADAPSISGSGNIQVVGSNNNVALPPKKDPIFKASFGVSTDDVCLDQEDWANDTSGCQLAREKISYRISEGDKEIIIAPVLNKLINPNLHMGENVSLRYPKLDIKILNNSDQTFFIDSVKLIDLYSSDDENVYLVGDVGCSNTHIAVHSANRNYYNPQDDGQSLWRQAQLINASDARIDFSISYNGRTSGLYSTPLTIKDKNHFQRGILKVSTYLPFKDIGVDIEGITKANEETDFAIEEFKIRNEACSEGDQFSCKKLPKTYLLSKINTAKLKKYGAVFSDKTNQERGYVTNPIIDPMLQAEISYNIVDYFTGEKRRVAHKFEQSIDLVSSFGCGAPAPVSDKYSIELSHSKENYSVSVPVSHSVKPGETDRFTIKLGTEFASLHKFKVVIGSVNGEQVISKPITVYIP